MSKTHSIGHLDNICQQIQNKKLPPKPQPAVPQFSQQDLTAINILRKIPII